MRRSRLARAGVIFVAWTLVGLFSVTPTLVGQLAGDGRHLRFGLVAINLESVWLWAAFTPLLFRLAERFPVTRQAWGRRLLLHAGLALALNLVDAVADRLLLPLVGIHYHEPFLTTYTEQLFINVFSYGAVVTLGQGMAQAALARARLLRETQLGAELAHARLRALEMQLRPHFLFNALHSIGSLIRARKNPEALRTVVELGDLLRAMLRGDGTHEATVHEELELTMQYLRIQEVRFGDRLETRVSVTPEALPARVPRFVLQPLVENAVLHGVESEGGPARIDLRASVEDGMVWLSVRDGGGAAQGGERRGQGIGLANTRARLEHLYGEHHRLELLPADGGGVLARVGIPYHVGPAAPVAGAS